MKSSNLLMMLAVTIGIAFLSAEKASADLISGSTANAVVAKSSTTETIREHLVSQGMTYSDATELLSHMTPEELSFYAADTGRTQAAGDGGAVVFVLVVIALVLLIIYLADRL